jgi:hypothetical protein
VIRGNRSVILDRKARTVTEMSGIWTRSPASRVSLDQLSHVSVAKVERYSWASTNKKKASQEVVLVRKSGGSFSVVVEGDRATAQETAAAVGRFLGLENK